MCLGHEQVGVTEQLYLPDADSVTAFTATVTEASSDHLVLDGTYFYPEGGGQPADTGRIEWSGGHAGIGHVRKDHGDVHHVVESIEGPLPEPGVTVEAQIDERRRARLSRMHTAQHVVSRVVLDEYGAATAGNRLYTDRSRIDFEPVSLDESDVERIEHRSNKAIERDLPVRKENRPRGEVEQAVDEGRALLDLIPDSVDPLRVVEMPGFDMCPCGGTHVDSLGDIGEISIVDRTSRGAETERIEFELV